MIILRHHGHGIGDCSAGMSIDPDTDLPCINTSGLTVATPTVAQLNSANDASLNALAQQNCTDGGGAMANGVCTMPGTGNSGLSTNCPAGYTLQGFSCLASLTPATGAASTTTSGAYIGMAIFAAIALFMFAKK